jgi:ATP-dependent DNA helicase RecQ
VLPRRVPEDLPHLEAMRESLARHFGHSDFREGQAEVISSVLGGRNTVVVMPTGAGKSLCYQLPAVMLEGVTLVISPLIALMQDQVDALTARGIAATFVNSTLSDIERANRQHRIANGEFKLVYAAPERFRSEAFVNAVLKAGLALFAVDEAHCISQWGHDFRPDYAMLGKIRKRLLPPRTVALTATATPEVREDVAKVLLMKDPQVFVAGFDRPNLFLEVATVTGETDKKHAVISLARELGGGVLYCPTRRMAESLHEALDDDGVPAVLYHAGMDDNSRREAQEKFMGEPNAVAVATNAFGMGIDKPDIRFVAHAGVPRAVEAYYQEIGRAGRDGAPSRALLLFNHADVFTQERMIAGSHPPAALFQDAWQLLRDHGPYDRGLKALATQLDTGEMELGAVLRLLEREGHLSRGGRGEGMWTFAVTPGLAGHQPRSPDARAALDALNALLPASGTLSCELYQLSRRSGLSEEPLKHGLSLLERGGMVRITRPFSGRAITTLKEASFAELGLDLTRVRRQEAQALKMLRRMTDYAYAKTCRRAFILRYFGDQASESNCQSCDVCTGAQTRLSASNGASRSSSKPQLATAQPVEYSQLAAEELRRWRKELSTDLGIPAFILFNDATLFALAAALPTNRVEFLAVKGTGESRWERFGPAVVEICLTARAAGFEPQAVPARAKKRKSRR